MNNIKLEFLLKDFIKKFSIQMALDMEEVIKETWEVKILQNLIFIIMKMLLKLFYHL